MKHRIYPTVLGLNPPTKEIIITSTDESAYEVFIYHADFPEGTQRGQYSSENFDELRGLSSWLKFCDADALERFGQSLVDYARQAKMKSR